MILDPDAESAWIDATTPRDHLHEILAGLPSSRTALRPVGTAVNDARYDGPECLAPALESVQATLF